MPRLKEFDSKAITGAKFTLRYPGRQLRHRTELNRLAETRHKQRLIAQEQFSIIPPDIREDEAKLIARAKNLSDAEISRLDKLAGMSLLLQDEVKLAYVQEMLESYSIPGEFSDLITTEDLLESAPPLFAEEVMNEAMVLWGEPADSIKNSSRPTTSQEPVDGPTKTNDTTAIPANSDATTSAAIAA